MMGVEAANRTNDTDRDGARIAKLVAAAPPLRAETIDRIVSILRAGRS
jgi:hypothetical protein